MYEGDSHAKIRKVFLWTRRFDANMNRLPEPQVITLENIIDDHLLALVSYTEDGYPNYVNKIFCDEKEWRTL